MFKHFIRLEWKSFLRSASFGTSLAIKILMGFFAAYFIVMFLLLGFAIFPILKENGFEPLQTVNKFLIYYFVADLVMRFFLQKMPVMNIRPLLTLPIKRNTIVHFTLGKTALSFFNILHAFFFIPFSIVLIMKGFSIVNVLLWHLSIALLIFCNNYINVLINNKDSFFYPIVTVVVGLGLAQYFNFFDVTNYTSVFFDGLFHKYYFILIPILVLLALYYFAFTYFKSNLNLDEGLAKKSEIAKTENFTWLNQFGVLGTFLKNDIKLLKRNKRSRTTLIMSCVFIFYGLLFFNNPTQAKVMGIFAGIFVSGGFLFTFGQFVPSWDSSYYQLMMSQNIKYKEYLSSKWWLMVIATLISTLLASFYLFYGWHVYLLVVVGAIYNIGVNSHLVLLGGAFVKTPIDLTQSKGAFGDKQAFNVKTMLLAIPKLLVPVLLYGLGSLLYSENVGLLFVAIAGILGFAFKDKMFTQIEKIYRTEKYATIAAYKQKN
jgi:Family of unknown function (DUF5687)